jgi:hypothetical protein
MGSTLAVSLNLPLALQKYRHRFVWQHWRSMMTACRESHNVVKRGPKGLIRLSQLALALPEATRLIAEPCAISGGKDLAYFLTHQETVSSLL